MNIQKIWKEVKSFKKDLQIADFQKQQTAITLKGIANYLLTLKNKYICK